MLDTCSISFVSHGFRTSGQHYCSADQRLYFHRYTVDFKSWRKIDFFRLTNCLFFCFFCQEQAVSNFYSELQKRAIGMVRDIHLLTKRLVEKPAVVVANVYTRPMISRYHRFFALYNAINMSFKLIHPYPGYKC